MKISILLHFYQPHNQQKDILDRIVHESYLPITEGLLKDESHKVLINLNAALIELLQKNGHEKVLVNIKKLHDRGQVEFTSSSKYHAFLPLLPESELIRQVEINDKTNREYFGQRYSPQGFFPPEMSINQHVIDTVKKMGFTWTCGAEVAKEGDKPSGKVIYQDQKSGMYMFFRTKRVSVMILSAVTRTAEDLIKETRDMHDDKYWFCVMDAETFGHHRVGHEKFLFEVLEHEFFEPTLIRELLNSDIPVEKTSVRASTWTNEEQDFWLDKEMTRPTEARSFILWQDPTNPIHAKQWELTDLVIKEVENYPDKKSQNYLQARQELDQALASDQYWWASAKPWWSLEMLEQGAYMMKDVLRILEPDSEANHKADKLYREILDLAFEWQRSGFIRQRHLEDSDTFMKAPFKERTPSEWYNQMILEFTDEMNRAAARQDFEKAVKWRDAVLKLKRGTDVYDVLHVVNELWTARNIPEVKPFLEHDWDEFDEFAKEHFLDVKDKEGFEKWKKRKQEEKKKEKPAD